MRVVETGSFSAAARDLRVGQPAVSKTIASLEARLGVRLLVRSTRRLRPTEAGQAFHERARRVLDEAERPRQPREASEADSKGGYACVCQSRSRACTSRHGSAVFSRCTRNFGSSS